MSNVDLTPEERAKIVAERADVKYGPFASLHEAYGVLAEELWELEQCFTFEVVPNHGAFMRVLHLNSEDGFINRVYDARSWVHRSLEMLNSPLYVKKKFNKAREECIDVIAVCDRIITQWGEK